MIDAVYLPIDGERVVFFNYRDVREWVGGCVECSALVLMLKEGGKEPAIMAVKGDGRTLQKAACLNSLRGNEEFFCLRLRGAKLDGKFLPCAIVVNGVLDMSRLQNGKPVFPVIWEVSGGLDVTRQPRLWRELRAFGRELFG